MAILCLIPLRLFWARAATPDRRLGPHTAVHFLFAAYAFWIFSYTLTTAPLSNLISYDFLRFNGAIFVGYLPLLLFSDVGLSSRAAYRLVWIYLGILTGVAVLSAGLLLLASGHMPFLRSSLLGKLLSFESGHEMPIMLLGLYRTHMAAGNQYAMAALVALCFMLLKKNPRIVSWTSLVFINLIAAMILSGARTAYVAFSAAFLIQFAWKKRYFKPLVRIGALILVPTLLFFLSQPDILNRATTIIHFEGKDNVEGRFELYQMAWKDYSESPLIGIGFGRFSEIGKTYFGLRHLVYIATDGKTFDADESPYRAHNSYLQFLAEGGLVGLFLMLGVWTTTYSWVVRMRKRLRDGSQAAALCEAVQACVLVTFFSSFTGTSMMTATTPLFVFTLVGLLRNVLSSDCRAQIAMSVSRFSGRVTPVVIPLATPKTI